jgi:hypothetical protein
MAAGVAARLLQCIDEAWRGCLGIFSQVVGDCILDVLAGRLARDDLLGLPDLLRVFVGEDVAQPDEEHIDLPQALSAVKERIAKALELKRQGWSTKRIVHPGLR